MMDVRQALRERILFLDGATGTNLQKAGMPAGVCPELWILEHPQVLLDLQSAYVRAGSDIVYAPTFSGNAFKLEEYGVRERLVEINQKLVALSHKAAGGKAFVAGNLTMTGRSLKPTGDLDFEELVDCYKEQVSAIADAGVDLFVVETMMSVQECRAAVLAVKETTDLPVFVTITIEESGKTLYGTDAVSALITMEALGVDAFGVNCSCGPDALLSLTGEMAQYTNLPIIIKPNAGLPCLKDGRTVYDMSKEDFARHMKAIVDAGASVVGGCCGTDPSYIEEMSNVIQKENNKSKVQTLARHGGKRLLSSERGHLEITLDGQFHIVGERINPTGKKKLQKELLEGSLELVSEMAEQQTLQGASILDVNVGMGGIDEKAVMLEVLERVGEVTPLPLCIDSSSPEVVETALRRYPGRALVNSISCEKVKIEKLLPAVKKYGAMFILLPLTDDGLPQNQIERWENVEYVLEHAYELGFSKEDVVVDGLVGAVAAEPMAARDTLDTIKRCREEGLATICGLSNISFGLPDRSYVNGVFLAMAVQQGLTMAISNPSQELFVRSTLAADLLMGKEDASIRYVEGCNRFSQLKQQIEQPLSVDAGTSGIETSAKGEKTDITSSKEDLREQIRQDVLKGRRKQIEGHLQEALKVGEEASALLSEVLIGAINEVGDLFNAQKYFLPQLIISAQTMQTGVSALEPILQKSQTGTGKGPTVIMATVKGDIHDIGKNLVVMMMKNYGFQVIDLGKDVDKERIISAAKEHSADVIGLSALMTTTMTYMKEVIDLVHQEGMTTKVIVGGAAVTEEYAKEIGADGYSEDAVGAVELVKKLMGMVVVTEM